MLKKAFACAAIAAVVSLVGCKSSYKGGKVVEGTDAFVGLNMPLTDGTVQFEVLNYLSGFRYSFDRDAEMECWYTCTNSTSFCGYESRKDVRFHAILKPTADEVAATPCCTNGCSCAESTVVSPSGSDGGSGSK